MPLERPSRVMVIAGASSLVGSELKSLLEESRFAGWDLQLVDEESAAGILTEALGEPVVIQPVGEDTFRNARVVFFTGSPAFTVRNLRLAMGSPAGVIDLSGAPDDGGARPWFPELPEGAPGAGKKWFSVASAPATASALLALALEPLGLKELSITHFRPVSEAGRHGIEELESQASRLLSMQPVGTSLFGTQVAFTLVDRYGREAQESLARAIAGVRSQTAQALGAGRPVPAMTLVHAPVFYGAGFSALASLDARADAAKILEACAKAGFRLHPAEDGPLGNLTVAGEHGVFLAEPQPEPARPGLWWFWGAADNIRLPAYNAVKLAEKLTA